MFPNVRVMIVAFFASILGIGCGLGALAALRVNHQPFARLQGGDLPLQLVFGDGMPGTVTDGAPAPFGARFQVSAPLRAPASPPQALNVSLNPAAAIAPASDSDPQTNSPRGEVIDGAADSRPDGQDPELKQAATEQSAPAAPAQESPPAAVETVPDAQSGPEPKSTASIDSASEAKTPPESALPTAPSATTLESVPAKSAPKAGRRRFARPHHPRKPKSEATISYPNQNFGAAEMVPLFALGTPPETPQIANQAARPVLRREVIKRRRRVKKVALPAEPPPPIPAVAPDLALLRR